MAQRRGRQRKCLRWGREEEEKCLFSQSVYNRGEMPKCSELHRFAWICSKDARMLQLPDPATAAWESSWFPFSILIRISSHAHQCKHLSSVLAKARETSRKVCDSEGVEAHIFLNLGTVESPRACEVWICFSRASAENSGFFSQLWVCLQGYEKSMSVSFAEDYITCPSQL